MRVLFLTSNFPPLIGGSGVVYEALCRELREEAFVLTASHDYRTGEELAGWRECDARQPFRVIRARILRPPHNPATTRPGALMYSIFRQLPTERRIASEVRQLIGEVKPDLVCLGELYSLGALAMSTFVSSGVPFVVYTHGEELNVSHGRRLAAAGAELLRRAAGVIAVSSYTANRLKASGVPEQKVHLVPNGVDTARFTPGLPEASLVERWGLAGKRVLMTIARLEEKKGQDMVIRALPEILRAVPDAVYVVVGQGNFGDQLRRLAREVGVADRVVFTGAVPAAELVNYYRTADVFVHPNRQMPDGDTEGFGLIFLEASACGKAVIGGNAGGVPDAVKDGETGLLVDGWQTGEIAAACTRLLQDATLRESMGQAGLAWAGQCGWPQRAKLFRAVCENAAERKVRVATALSLSVP